MAPVSLTQHIRDLRVLVTGGSGFLGAHIVQRLLDEGATSIAVVSRTPKPIPVETQFKDRVLYHAVDVADDTQINEVFSQFKPHAVIHTAAPHYTDAAALQQRINVEGTRILLQASIASPETRAFVYTSSDSATVPAQHPLTEEKAELYTDTNFPNHYGRTKAVADAMTLQANSEALATATLRIPGLYGENDHNFIPLLLSSIRKNEHKMQVGQDNKVFEFLYVKKAAEAHVLALRALLDPSSASSVSGEAFFISDGRPEPFFAFSRRCYAAAGSPVDPKDVTVIPLAALQMAASAGEWAYSIFTLGTVQPNLRRMSVDHLDRGVCFSIEKAKLRLGYEPVADQDGAIQRSMDWALATL